MEGGGVMKIKIIGSIMVREARTNSKFGQRMVKRPLYAYLRNTNYVIVPNLRKKETNKKTSSDTKNQQINPSLPRVDKSTKNTIETKSISKKIIEEKAQEILRRFGVEYYSNVSALATRIGIKVGETDNIDDDDDGFIFISQDRTKKAIGVNSNRTLKQKRFIVAHELGHYFLHYNETDKSLFAFRENRKGKDAKENDADYFAACLLMPTDTFLNAYMTLSRQKNKFSKQDIIDKLSNEFCVPKESIVRRIAEVGCDSNE